MSENPYSRAGWLTIVSIGLVPLSLICFFVFTFIPAKMMNIPTPSFGLHTLVDIVGAGINVYIVLKFRDLLHDHYSFFDIDHLIVADIILIIFMQISGLALGGIEMVTAGAPNAEIFLAVLVIIWLTVACLVGGTISIMMAIKLMKLKEQASDPLKFYIYLLLISGIITISVIFAPLMMLIFPILGINLAVIFFRDHQQVEFV